MASVVDDVNTTVVNVDSTPPGFDPNANNNNNNNNTNDNNTEENAFTQWSATDADKLPGQITLVDDDEIVVGTESQLLQSSNAVVDANTISWADAQDGNNHNNADNNNLNNIVNADNNNSNNNGSDNNNNNNNNNTTTNNNSTNNGNRNNSNNRTNNKRHYNKRNNNGRRNNSRNNNNNSNGHRGHGRYHQHNVFNNRNEVKVSGETNPKAAAGAIAHQTRAGEPPLVLASGNHSINQAIKAIAIARGYLKDEGIDISASPEFRDSHGNAVCFDVRKRKRNYKTLQQQTDDLKVASTSDPNIVAGAVAGKIRSMGNGLVGTRICLQAIGPNCVLQAVSSISVARRYLENDCIDLSFRPEFIEVNFEDGQVRNALRFNIMVQQI